jgi:probable rRNA maturation factor
LSVTEVAWCIEGERPLADGAVERAVRAALRHGERALVELSVVFVTDPVLAEMHAKHLGDSSETDVISFDLGEDTVGPAGELYISVDRARAVAGLRGSSLERELLLYVVHGALHLCGYDDHEDDERERMRTAERHVMGELGFPPDGLPHDIDHDDVGGGNASP